MDRAFVSSRDTDLQFYDCLLSTIRIWIQRKVSVLLIRIKNFFLDPELFVFGSGITVFVSDPDRGKNEKTDK